jgi:LPS export ABC transporter permease LptF/LPS export ABC transporter permease LptG
MVRPEATRRPRWTLYRYVAREALRPFLLALVGLTTVVLLGDLIGFSELVINRGLGVGEVALIAFYEAVPVAAFIFPFSVLLAALVALGRLGADREILVLEASGISASRLVAPVTAFALALTSGSAALSLFGAPAATRALDASLEEIATEQPWAQFRAGTVNEFGGWQVEAREVSAKGDQLKGVLLWIPALAETLFARRGGVTTRPEGGAEITLRQGSLLLLQDDGAQQVRFSSLSVELPESDEPLVRDEETRLQGWPLRQLWEASQTFVPTAELPVSSAWVELHRRLSFPVATLLFGMLAVPLFLTRQHFSRSGGSVLGVVTTVAYFALVQLGEGLVQAGGLSVAAGVWLPNVVIFAVALLLLARARREGVLGQRFDRPTRRADRDTRPRGMRRPGRPHRYALPRYIATRFVELAAVAFAALLVAYLLIDIMERLDWFARYRASGSEVLRFYLARVPLLASRVVPMALLVGTALVVSLLAVEGELMGMRACGIPAPRALLPVLLIAIATAPMYFVLRNVVVPRTNALADELKQTEIKEDYYRDLAERRKTAVWRRTGSRVLAASRFDTDRGDARDLTIYEIGADGLPEARSDARDALHIGRGIWRLSDPRRVEVVGMRVRVVPPHSYADLGEDLPSQVDTMHLSVGQLAEEIEAIEADGYDATPLRVDFHVKLADALACIVLPASVLFFAVGGPPFPGPAQTLLVSGAVAVGYILLTGVGSSLGYGGTIPPPVGGWAPTGIIAAVAAWLAARLWREM